MTEGPLERVLGPVEQAAGDVVGGTATATGGLLGGVASALHDLASPAPSVVGAPPAEPGHQTSEFRMTAVKSLLLAVFGVLAAYGVGVPASVQNIAVASVPVAIAILGAGYSLSRGKRKSGTA
jgi:hypothetical protein